MKSKMNSFQGTKVFGVLLVLFCALMLPQVFAATSTQGDYLYLAEISSPRFVPSTISAGDLVSLAVDLTNKGATVNMDDVNAELEVGNYFEPVSISDHSLQIKSGETKTFVLKFRVKDNTPAGIYNVSLNVNYLRQGQVVSQVETVNVTVSSAQNNVA
ncbi:MAG: hypothetical protein WCW44_06335, partial [archaeon]